MTGIRIICVGRMKEKFFSDAAAEYVKRLRRYANVEVVEVPDRSAAESLSEAQKREVVDSEGQKALRAAEGCDFLIALDATGRKLDSESFAGLIEKTAAAGKSRIGFVVGGSLGLSGRVKEKADMLVSFSDMTFPHNLFRIMLLEQIYRAYRIINGEPYHK